MKSGFSPSSQAQHTFYYWKGRREKQLQSGYILAQNQVEAYKKLKQKHTHVYRLSALPANLLKNHRKITPSQKITPHSLT